MEFCLLLVLLTVFICRLYKTKGSETYVEENFISDIKLSQKSCVKTFFGIGRIEFLIFFVNAHKQP